MLQISLVSSYLYDLSVLYTECLTKILNPISPVLFAILDRASELETHKLSEF